METIGDRIFKLRASRQWTQDDLASKVGVSRVSVTKWESGETKNMKLHNLMMLCDLFHVSPEFLIYGKHPIKTIYPEPENKNLLEFLPRDNSDMQEIIEDLPDLNAEELKATKSVVKTLKNRKKIRKKLNNNNK